MRIGDIDKNLQVNPNPDFPELKWFTPYDAPLEIHGIQSYSEEGGFLRMPVEIAKQCNGGVEDLCHNTAGGRIRFRTDSKHLAAIVRVPYCDVMPHNSPLGQSGFDMYISDDHRYQYYCSGHPVFKDDPEGKYRYEFLRTTDGKMHTYTINMPLYSDVTAFYIGLSPDANLEPVEDYAIPQPVLYYGSSITQGGCASRPGNSYQAFISRRFDCDFINLGFSGSGKAEPAMCEYIANLHPSIFVMDYDHNAPDVAYLEATHENMFRVFRASNSTTPVIMISKPDFKATVPEDAARREIIKKTYTNAIAAGDQNVYFIDGEALFEGPFRDSCTVDGCHPNDLGFYRMAMVIGDVMAPLIESIK